MKSGYTVTVAVDANLGGNTVVMPAANTCNLAAADAIASYYASSTPVAVGSTGQRAFATDVRGTLFYSMNGVAPINPIPVGALILQ